MELIEEKIILKNLVTNDEYFSKVFPFLSEKVFTENYTKKLFKCIYEYNHRYNKRPNIPVLTLFVEQVKGVSASDYAEMSATIDFFNQHEEYNLTWLCDKSLEFIQHRTYFDFLVEGADSFEKGELDRELPEKLNKALSISFDSEIGMEFEDAEKRWDAYTLQEDRIPFLVEKLNEITKGGFTRKTLNCFMSSNTGGFKSGAMCSLSCDYIRQGYNVLYLSFEMAENKILERIDANMLDIPIDDIVKLGKEKYLSRIDEIRKKTRGRLIVKQYPTSSCHVGNIRYLLRELQLKENFKPDVIMFDYLGIMASMRYKENVAEHIWLKGASEEVRGLCVEYDVIGITAMQSNRGGASAGVDLSIGDISASYGTVYGFDLIWGLVTSPEFDEEHKIMIRQLKNRYSDMNLQPKFFLSLNKPKMKLSDLMDDVFSENTPTHTVKANDDAEKSVFAVRLNRNGTSNTKFQFD